MINLVKLQCQKKRYYTLTIPKEFIEKLGWAHGDTIIAHLNDNSVKFINSKDIVL